MPAEVHQAADAALDKAFGAFGIANDGDAAADGDNAQSWGGESNQAPTGGGDGGGGGGGGGGGEAGTGSSGMSGEQKEKLLRHQDLLRDLLGEEFVVQEPVMELRVHATSIAVGQLDVEIGGTSAAWLYNMIALVLTQQLRGTIEVRTGASSKNIWM